MSADCHHRKVGSRRAFTLIELLVAMAVTLMILTLMLQMLRSAATQWRSVRENVQAFQSARSAFDAITRSLAQATLAVEYDYYNAARQSRSQLAGLGGVSGQDALRDFVPDVYGRSSGLHFISGRGLVAQQHTHAIFFQAPFDFSGAGVSDVDSGQLNAVGYFIRYGSDADDRPPNISGSQPPPRNRFRLQQYLQPTAALDVYRTPAGSTWFTKDTDANPNKPANTHLLAENIVALALLPKLPDEQGQPPGALAPGYLYDSRTPWSTGAQPIQMHQLPPVVRVMMVAIDEESAKRNPGLGADFKNLFQSPDSWDQDLQTIETTLQGEGANYRIFQTDVPLRAAKWSE